MLEILDFLGNKPSIYIYGKSRFKTTIGVVLSIVAAVSVLVLSGYFLLNFFQKKEMNIIYYRETKNFQPDVNISFFMYFFMDVDEKLVDPRLATVIPGQFVYINGTRTFSLIDTEPCTDNQYVKSRPDIITFDVSKHTCFKMNNIELKYLPNLDSTYYSVYIVECTNSTANNNHCYPKSVIAEKLRSMNMKIDYVYPTYAIDHNNKTHPIQEVAQRQNPRIVYDFFYNFFHYYNALSYASDEGLVFEEVITQNTYIYDDGNSNVQVRPFGTRAYLPNCISLLQIYMNEKYGESYKRSYPKLQSVIANIGGILKFIMTIGNIITTYISSSMMFIELSNHITFEESAGIKKKLSTSLSKMIVVESPIKVRKERKKLTLWEAIVPGNLSSQDSTKRLLYGIESFIKKKLSCDYFLDCFKLIEKINESGTGGGGLFQINEANVIKCKSNNQKEAHVYDKNEIELHKSRKDEISSK